MNSNDLFKKRPLEGKHNTLDFAVKLSEILQHLGLGDEIITP